jgi:hypothetical protein
MPSRSLTINHTHCQVDLAFDDCIRVEIKLSIPPSQPYRRCDLRRWS